ncbi:hypothetical protein VTI74DRAFT_5780 [Chaetomium olivicolor]
MATSIPLPSFKAQIPVTPPPEFQMFMKGPPPQIPRPFAQGVHQTPPSSTTASTLLSEQSRGPSQPSQPSSASSDPSPKPPPSQPSLSSQQAQPHQLHADPTAAAAVDPRYIAMASRIASYYQQRCQAVANFQQQRCQAWANAQRQKCQEMMQAATVIVAWYIRDRISRRRKRQKRAFRRGLAARTAVAAVPAARENAGYRIGKDRDKERDREAEREREGAGRVTRGEAVRRWVMDVPIGSNASPPSTASRDLPADKDEIDFDMDREVPADKDSQLFNVADNLIKSHLARVDVPLLGVLSFDESESESESEEDDFMDYEDELDDGEEEDEEYEDGDGEEEDDDDDVGCGGETEELASTSKDAQLGTTVKGSRKRSHSEIS